MMLPMDERRIKISAGAITVTANLNCKPTADALWDTLPFVANGLTWGDEIYFSIPIEAKEESDSQDVVDIGTIAYWPPGSAMCIFFGPTPASHGDEIRAASPVNIIGHISGDAKVLKYVRSGTQIIVEKIYTKSGDL